MDRPEIKDWYEHEHRPSVFVMFTSGGDIVWSYSGNALRSGYLEKPDAFISGPIEVPIPDYVDRALTELWDNPLSLVSDLRRPFVCRLETGGRVRRQAMATIDQIQREWAPKLIVKGSAAGIAVADGVVDGGAFILEVRVSWPDDALHGDEGRPRPAKQLNKSLSAPSRQHVGRPTRGGRASDHRASLGGATCRPSHRVVPNV